MIHRPDFQRILYDAAVSAGVVVRFNAGVDSVDASSTSAILDDGGVWPADLILIADG